MTMPVIVTMMTMMKMTRTKHMIWHWCIASVYTYWTLRYV